MMVMMTVPFGWRRSILEVLLNVRVGLLRRRQISRLQIFGELVESLSNRTVAPAAETELFCGNSCSRVAKSAWAAVRFPDWRSLPEKRRKAPPFRAGDMKRIRESKTDFRKY
jgi:hypothetical protein